VNSSRASVREVVVARSVRIERRRICVCVDECNEGNLVVDEVFKKVRKGGFYSLSGLIFVVVVVVERERER
jgi:hypothetical protein